MNAIRHWWWHVVAMLAVCDFSKPHDWAEEEVAAYKAIVGGEPETTARTNL